VPHLPIDVVQPFQHRLDGVTLLFLRAGSILGLDQGQISGSIQEQQTVKIYMLEKLQP